VLLSATFLGPLSLLQIFNRHASKNPMQYISCVRVKKAKELLKYDSANMSISQIATAVGFYDSSNLNKHFKKVTGLTPSAFKLKAKTASSK
jgi:AraC family transcriptional regulator